MVLLIDTNVILDYLLKREPFYSDAEKIFQICGKETTDGCIALHTVTTLRYILRKFSPETQRRKTLDSVCGLLRVVGASHEDIIDAINDDTFADFEDCVQTKCALSAGADYIITNNIKDYKYSVVPALTPKEFLGTVSPLS